MNNLDMETAVIGMGDVLSCIDMIDDAITDGEAEQQVRAIRILKEIFGSRYMALNKALNSK